MKITRAELSKIVKEEIQKLAPRKKIVEAPEDDVSPNRQLGVLDFSPERFTMNVTDTLFENDSLVGNTVASTYVRDVFKAISKVVNKNETLVSTLGSVTPDDVADHFGYMLDVGDADKTLDEIEYEISQGVLGVLMDASEKIAETVANYYSMAIEMK